MVVEDLKAPVKPNVKFFSDSKVFSIKDVGAGVLPKQSVDPYLNSFFAFFHDTGRIEFDLRGVFTIPIIFYQPPLKLLYNFMF